MQQEVGFDDMLLPPCGGLEGGLDEFLLYTALSLGVVASTSSTVRGAFAQAARFTLHEQLTVALFAGALYSYVSAASSLGAAFALGYCVLPVVLARLVSRASWFQKGDRKAAGDLALAALLWTPVACHVTDRIAGRPFPAEPDLAFLTLAFAMSLFVFLAARRRLDLRLDLPEPSRRYAPYAVGLAAAGLLLVAAFNPLAEGGHRSLCASAHQAVTLGSFPVITLWLVGATLVAGLVFQSLVQSTLEQIAGPGFGASLTSAAATAVFCALFFFDSIRADIVGGFFILGLGLAAWFHHSRNATAPAVYGVGAAFCTLSIGMVLNFLAGIHY